MTTAYKDKIHDKRENVGGFNYAQIAAKAASHLIEETAANGYISAAEDYSWYKPHWFRDSSWVAISLLEYYSFAHDLNEELALLALETANNIIRFNIDSVDRFIGNIAHLERIKYEDPDFFDLRYHMPSRCGPEHGFFKSEIIDDTFESNTKHSWLMQYDSIPLILLSLQKKQDYAGLSKQEEAFLNGGIEQMLKYLGKIFITECPSMWEINAGMLHMYDIAAIHSTFEFAVKLSDEHVIGMSAEDVRDIETKYYKSGTLGFIKKYFLSEGTLYSEKRPFTESPETESGLDGSEIFAFNYFGIDSVGLGDPTIEERTVKRIEETLFGGNMLPIRFSGDIYFTGGRWLLLGLEFANYYAKHGNVEKAKRIVDYVETQYCGDYPEQEIVNPASPGTDQGNYYALNGYTPIQKLAWSYASMIIASTTLANISDQLLGKE